MIAYRYRPAFFEGFPNEQAEWKDDAELLDIPWIKQWSKDKGFSHYAVDSDWLMAILDGGKTWWVIARLSENPANIPQWDRGNAA